MCGLSWAMHGTHTCEDCSTGCGERAEMVAWWWWLHKPETFEAKTQSTPVARRPSGRRKCFNVRSERMVSAHQTLCKSLIYREVFTIFRTFIFSAGAQRSAHTHRNDICVCSAFERGEHAIGLSKTYTHTHTHMNVCTPSAASPFICACFWGAVRAHKLPSVHWNAFGALSKCSTHTRARLWHPVHALRLARAFVCDLFALPCVCCVRVRVLVRACVCETFNVLD